MRQEQENEDQEEEHDSSSLGAAPDDGIDDTNSTAVAGCTVANGGLPSSNKAYGKKEYWDERFGREESFDWLVSYEQLKKWWNMLVPKTAEILIVGCGSSNLSADMHDDGYERIVSTDYSEVVIEGLRAKYSDRLALKWDVADMTKLEQYGDESFDVVVDKAAMDALMVDEGDVWQPNPSAVAQAHYVCTNVHRVLKNNGIFLQVSFAQPHFRRKYLLGQHPIPCDEEESRGCSTNDQVNAADTFSSGSGTLKGRCRYGWSLECHDIIKDEGSFGYFLYVMRKESIEESETKDGDVGDATF